MSRVDSIREGEYIIEFGTYTGMGGVQNTSETENPISAEEASSMLKGLKELVDNKFIIDIEWSSTDSTGSKGFPMLTMLTDYIVINEKSVEDPIYFMESIELQKPGGGFTGSNVSFKIDIYGSKGEQTKYDFESFKSLIGAGEEKDWGYVKDISEQLDFKDTKSIDDINKNEDQDGI